jgi:hypothetical protein
MRNGSFVTILYPMIRTAASPHTFHIPVMGLGYTIDTPLKVAHFGISSVISIIEDELVERMREFHCRRSGEPYVPIPKEELDHRAMRITAYLDLIGKLVDRNVKALRAQAFEVGSDIVKYFEMLADGSPLKERFDRVMVMPIGEARSIEEDALREAVIPGSIDVNIMAKIDRTTYDKKGEPLPAAYADAMAAFRGFAKSGLHSSVVFSAGYNPRLYAYIEQFDDFLPDAEGQMKKRIILKVSDLRSALIQGKLLAKKGLLVSEFRVESGLNCGGHAFATDGVLMGPILEEFKEKRASMAAELLEMCNNALIAKGRDPFPAMPTMRVTAQGGIGTHAEDRCLREYYGVDGTGWGSPFLLVPEATNVDPRTLGQLSAATPDDYYMSWASPLGIPFHNFRPSTSEQQRKARIEKGRPGSPCYKKYLSTDTEFTATPICTASRQYQDLKIKQIKSKELDEATFAKELAVITEKDCLCEGLGASALLNEGMHPAHKLEAVAICPGPNTAYFSKIVPLKEMVDHIHGRTDLLNTTERPHMFAKELSLYIGYLEREINKIGESASDKQRRYVDTFRKNLAEGMAYYEGLLPQLRSQGDAVVERFRKSLERYAGELEKMGLPVAVV